MAVVPSRCVVRLYKGCAIRELCHRGHTLKMEHLRTVVLRRRKAFMFKIITKVEKD